LFNPKFKNVALHWVAEILHAKNRDTGIINCVISFSVKSAAEPQDMRYRQTTDDDKRHIVPKTRPNGRDVKRGQNLEAEARA